MRPSGTLKIFQAIDDETIRRALNAGESLFPTLRHDLEFLEDKRSKTAEESAWELHLRLLLAYCYLNRENFPFEIALHVAGAAAQSVAEIAEDSARMKGTSKAIGMQMDAILNEHGLAPEDVIFAGSGPPEYVALGKEHANLMERISDTVFTETLRRYGMGGLADLFESDEKEFEILMEIGRWCVNPPPSGRAGIAKYVRAGFIKRRGREAWERVRARVKELSDTAGLAKWREQAGRSRLPETD